MAKLYFRYGSMESGKTSELLQVAYNYEKNGLKTVLIKPKKDSKGDNFVVTRFGNLKREVDFVIDDNDNILDLIDLDGVSSILVEEAEFLSKENVWQLFEISKKYDIPVFCWGLKNDYKGDLFPGNATLFALADSIEEVTTICACGKKSRFNARMVKGEYVLDGPQVIIDGKSTDTRYVPMCGECFYKKVIEKNKERDLGWKKVKIKIKKQY